MPGYRADFPSSYAAVSRARRALVDFARWAGLHEAALNDFECAIGEALANAAEHGHREGANFTVTADVIDGMLVVDVKDNGSGFASWNATDYAPPPSTAPRGFGIFIMRSLVDQVEYSERGSRIRLSKKLLIQASNEDRREA